MVSRMKSDFVDMNCETKAEMVETDTPLSALKSFRGKSVAGSHTVNYRAR